MRTRTWRRGLVGLLAALGVGDIAEAGWFGRPRRQVYVSGGTAYYPASPYYYAAPHVDAARRTYVAPTVYAAPPVYSAPRVYPAPPMSYAPAHDAAPPRRVYASEDWNGALPVLGYGSSLAAHP